MRLSRSQTIVSKQQFPFREDWFKADQLHFAAADGNADRCAELFSQGYDPNTFDELGNTPLHYAAKEEHFEVVAVLLSLGANVNAHDEARIGNTPLAEIAGSCSLKMAQMLLKAGANPRIRGWMQLNAMDQAKNRKRGDGPAVFDLLCQYAAR
jgi:ankyrin repeat protein